MLSIVSYHWFTCRNMACPRGESPWPFPSLLTVGFGSLNGNTNRYIEALENRLEKMEKLLTKVLSLWWPNMTITLMVFPQLCPDLNLTKEPNVFEMDARSPQSISSSIFSSSPTTDKATKAIASSTPTDDYPSDDNDSAQKKLTDRIKQLRINPIQHRFFGKSSGVTLIQTAMDLKKEITGNDCNPKAPPPSSRR